MDDLNPYESPRTHAGSRLEIKHWRAGLAMSIPASLALWVVLLVLFLRPTIHHWALLGAVLIGSALGASFGLKNRWLTLVGAIAGGAILLAVTVLTVVTFVEPPAEVTETGPPRLFPGLAVYAGLGAGFGLLFGVTATLLAWGFSLFWRRKVGAQHGTAAERSHLRQ